MPSSCKAYCYCGMVFDTIIPICPGKPFAFSLLRAFCLLSVEFLFFCFFNQQEPNLSLTQQTHTRRATHTAQALRVPTLFRGRRYGTGRKRSSKMYGAPAALRPPWRPKLSPRPDPPAFPARPSPSPTPPPSSPHAPSSLEQCTITRVSPAARSRLACRHRSDIALQHRPSPPLLSPSLSLPVSRTCPGPRP